MPSSRNKKSRKQKKNIVDKIRSLSAKGRFLLFVATFAVLGGSVYAFSSFASESTDTYLRIRVAGLPSGTSVQMDSGPRAFTDSEPAHNIGYCGMSFSVRDSRLCDGFRIGPISISPQQIAGYRTVWSGCDATSPSGNSCWMRLYDGYTKNVTVTYVSTAPTPSPQEIYDTTLNIRVNGLPARQSVTLQSGPRAFTDSEPAHNVGDCGMTIIVSGSKTCTGYRIGPISISAPAVDGYDGAWGVCDGKSPSGASCWMRLYDGTSKTVTLTYKPKPAPVVTPAPSPAPTPTTAAEAYDTTLNIKVAGLPADLTQAVTLQSGPRAFSDSEPTHDVGDCGRSITFDSHGGRICTGYRIGPISISAPGVAGYIGKWESCDATSPSGASCWMRLYDGIVKGVVLRYAPAPAGVAAALPQVAPPAPPTSEIPCPTPRPTIRKGDKGDCVKRAQDLLNKIINAGLNPDGDFGDKTKSAVVRYQQAKGMTADGIVGNQTWVSLESGGTNNATPIGTTSNPDPSNTGKSPNSSGSNNTPAPANLPAPTGADTNCANTITIENGQGNIPKCVVIIQKKVGADPDGIYGRQTYNKVIAYREKHGIPPCTSSSIGPEQWPYFLGQKTNGPGCGGSSKPTGGNAAAPSSGVRYTTARPSEYHANGSDTKDFKVPKVESLDLNLKVCVSVSPSNSSTASAGIPFDSLPVKFIDNTGYIPLANPRQINGVWARAGCMLWHSAVSGSYPGTVSKSGYWINVYEGSL